jgi:adenosylmethionine-8-amino-7-oxononanoate aminotransferase
MTDRASRPSTMVSKRAVPSSHAVDGVPNSADEPLSAVLHRDLSIRLPKIARAKGSYVILDDGRQIFDGSGGAAVASIGHGNQRVLDAVCEQMAAVAYCSTIFYTTAVQESLGREIVESTHGHMSRAYIVSSGKCKGRQAWGNKN